MLCFRRYTSSRTKIFLLPLWIIITFKFFRCKAKRKSMFNDVKQRKNFFDKSTDLTRAYIIIAFSRGLRDETNQVFRKLCFKYKR